MFDPKSAVVESLPVVGGLYFGYTQTSLWDLSTSSAPFRDTSYRPSLFYQWETAPLPDSENRWLMQLGVEHESNGRDGDNSRSINTAFMRMDWRHQLNDEGLYFGAIPKLWTYLEKDDNPDMQYYRGYGELGLRFGYEKSWLGQLSLRRGVGGKGSTQFDLSVPLSSRILSDTGSFLHFQYFEGQGETLLDYDRARQPQLRVGISLVR